MGVGGGVRVPNRVRIARVAKGLTQQQLAAMVGVSRQTIGLIEKEQFNPSITLCLKLAMVLDKGLDYLFMQDDR